MVAVARVAEVDDGGVVEHRAVALGDGLEFRGKIGEQFHVVHPDDVAGLLGGLSVAILPVADAVDILI